MNVKQEALSCKTDETIIEDAFRLSQATIQQQVNISTVSIENIRIHLTSLLHRRINIWSHLYRLI